MRYNKSHHGVFVCVRVRILFSFSFVQLQLNNDFVNKFYYSFSILSISSRCSQWNTRQDDELTYTENDEFFFIHSDMCDRGAIDSLSMLFSSLRCLCMPCVFGIIAYHCMGACVQVWARTCVCVFVCVSDCMWDRNIYFRRVLYTRTRRDIYMVYVIFIA